ncbi:MAG: RNA polymerase sigma factor [bacterium]
MKWPFLAGGEDQAALVPKGKPNFEEIVEAHYQSLYRFALSLARNEAEACDLTQQAFYLWASRGHQLRDGEKAKAWLFTVLHREFIGARRRENKFFHEEISMLNQELPAPSFDAVNAMDGSSAMRCLKEVEETYRAPLALFYLEDYSYKEIAQILKIPVGTVMSRLARGKQQLRRLFLRETKQLEEKQNE